MVGAVQGCSPGAAERAERPRPPGSSHQHLGACPGSLAGAGPCSAGVEGACPSFMSNASPLAGSSPCAAEVSGERPLQERCALAWERVNAGLCRCSVTAAWALARSRSLRLSRSLAHHRVREISKNIRTRVSPKQPCSEFVAVPRECARARGDRALVATQLATQLATSNLTSTVKLPCTKFYNRF